MMRVALFFKKVVSMSCMTCAAHKKKKAKLKTKKKKK